MGNRPVRSKQEDVAFVPPGMDLLDGNDGKVYLLKQVKPGSTKNTFWRADPRTNQLESGADYPRHGAVLRGKRIAHPNTGESWLIATHVAQNGGRAGWRYAPKGAAMPFQSKTHTLKEVSVTLS